ncbi:MAG: hypothetical protein MK538_17235, partial [Planctomycetes bacterium]|nr:hypothetical protein [Planctomycetota bacterium]
MHRSRRESFVVESAARVLLGLLGACDTVYQTANDMGVIESLFSACLIWTALCYTQSRSVTPWIENHLHE